MAIPAFGLGTFRLKDDVVISSVKTALELDYRAIDTAQIYDNEADVYKRQDPIRAPTAAKVLNLNAIPYSFFNYLCCVERYLRVTARTMRSPAN